MNEEFTITRKIELDAAHRVPHHESKCFNIHGHRYVVEATCKGMLFTEGPQRGMVMDFSFLKMLMMNVIHEPCDHACIFWKEDELLPNSCTVGWKLYTMEDVPTAENLARHWYHELQGAIDDWWQDKTIAIRPKLIDITVWETPNCKASYPYD